MRVLSLYPGHSPINVETRVPITHWDFAGGLGDMVMFSCKGFECGKIWRTAQRELMKLEWWAKRISTGIGSE